MVVREITNLKFDENNEIEALFNPKQSWSPVLKDEAIFEILSGQFKYRIFIPEEVEIIVKEKNGNPYLAVCKENIVPEIDVPDNQIMCLKLAKLQKLCSNCKSLVLKNETYCWKCHKKNFMENLEEIMLEIKRQNLC